MKTLSIGSQRLMQRVYNCGFVSMSCQAPKVRRKSNERFVIVFVPLRMEVLQNEEVPPVQLRGMLHLKTHNKAQ